MPLAPRTRLGSYEILSGIGVGGMGEVYRARDTRLGRDVALKVLLEAFAANTERMARFEREAKVLASLNHPNIATIHGLEDSNGLRALVMELVEGQTLADRIAQGPIPLDEALPIAKQIAEGLEYAHERGIIHRDLKPANIKITPEGTVKLLDFGLAKALEGEAAISDPSTSPTLSHLATQAGAILGTAAYMSPEQAKGKSVDRRADIWAFGCVLFEMLAANQTFDGETGSEILAAVIKEEPNWAALPSLIPPRIRELVRRCLQKDAKQRLQAIGDARIAIEEALSGGTGISPAEGHGPEGGVQGRPRLQALSWAVAAGLAVLGIGALILSIVIRQRRPPEAQAILTSLVAPAGSAFRFVGLESGFALSPDGQRLAYIASTGEGKTALWLRSLDSPSGQVLAGTEGATAPFWSPDSKFIGFFSGGKLKKVDASGGSPLTICNAHGGGGTWNREGDILFASGRIYRVSAAGGTPVAVTRVDPARKGRSHHWPYFLPDGRHFLYLQGNSYAPPEIGTDGIFVASLDSKETKFLVKANSGAAYASGYLFYLRGTTLMAQRFDLQHLATQGSALPLAEKVRFDELRLSGMFSASENGLLAYAESSRGTGLQLQWFDRSGKRLGAVPDKHAYCCPQLSPDGSKVIYDAERSGKRDLWVYDFTRGTKTRLTFGTQSVGTAVWSPDGTRVLYSSNRNGRFGLYEKAADGSGAEETVLAPSENASFPYSWSPDASSIVYDFMKRGTDQLWILPLTGDRKPYQFVRARNAGVQGDFSPDGKWVAYGSDETGQLEIYAAAFPGAESRYQVSSGGGHSVQWGRDGKELFYISQDNKMMAVPIAEKGRSLKIGAPRPLFEVHDFWLTPSFNVSVDGKRFIVATFDDEASSPMTLIIHWLALLKRK